MRVDEAADESAMFGEPAEEPRPTDELLTPDADPERIQRQRAARHARLLHAGISDLARLIEVAERLACDLDVQPRVLQDYLNAVTERLVAVGADLGARIQPRQRPPAQLAPADAAHRPRSLVFIDECGNHTSRDRHFPYFCVTAAVIAAADYPAVEAAWRQWRRDWLVQPERATHEPTLRSGKLRYALQPGRAEAEAEASLEALLDSLPFTLVAAVLDHDAFASMYHGRRVDEFLPRDTYLMCFTFVLERVVHLLYHGLGDHMGLVRADQRGRREDALLQREFQRLKTEGTLFVADTWFRYQLGPHMEFLGRQADEVGLQIADLLARPIAERYADPTVNPTRWAVARRKLYAGGPGTRAAYGLKVFPGDHARLAAMLEA
ncbi:MAG TPA: DUF3800 domain-containing protein [Chloroflexota bacterium]|nr:DUF3800 domain-containing protein [Chloroflexota bacterium]